jgi:hypothetical protein
MLCKEGRGARDASAAATSTPQELLSSSLDVVEQVNKCEKKINQEFFSSIESS